MKTDTNTMTHTNTPYLAAGLPVPVPESDGLSRLYWEGLKAGRLMVQRCAHCRTWQFGPEWMCHSCRKFDPAWEEVQAEGRIYSWERCWHPVHPALKDQGPYLVVLIELPQCGGIRMFGNLLGDPLQEVQIGAAVRGVYEHHAAATPAFSLLQWQLA